MDPKASPSSDPSILLWMTAALAIVLGARAFLEYLRSVHLDGARQNWKDLILGALGLEAGIWAAMIVGISSLGLQFEVGYSPVRVIGCLVLAVTAAVGLVMAATSVRNIVFEVACAAMMAVVATGLQIGVILSLGAAPGLEWRYESIAFAALVSLAGHLLAFRMVLSIARGGRNDHRARRLLVALLVAAALVGAQELVLLAADLPHQAASAYARQLPEIVLLLLAGAAVPVMLVVMIIDQRIQRRIRRAARRRKRREDFEASRLATQPADDSVSGAMTRSPSAR